MVSRFLNCANLMRNIIRQSGASKFDTFPSCSFQLLIFSTNIIWSIIIFNFFNFKYSPNFARTSKNDYSVIFFIGEQLFSEHTFWFLLHINKYVYIDVVSYIFRWAPTSICHFFRPSVRRAPYLRNRTSSDHDFWYTCVKWWYLQKCFFIF